LLAEDQVDAWEDYFPNSECSVCGGELGELVMEENPYRRHQVFDLPPVTAQSIVYMRAFAQIVKDQLPNAQVEVVKRNELHTFKVLPKRWIVERSFAWLEKCR